MSAHDPVRYQAPPMRDERAARGTHETETLAEVLARKEPELLEELQRLFALERLIGEMSVSEAVPR